MCHESVIGWVSGKVKELSLSALGPVLEVGSFNVNGTIRPFFEAEGYRRYTADELKSALEKAGFERVIVESDPQVPGVFGVGRKKIQR